MKARLAATPAGSPAARLAWLLAFAAAVALLALCGLARSAQAMTAPAGPAGPPLALASWDDEEEAEEPEEAEEGEEDGLEAAWAECERLEAGEEQEACEEEVEEAEELEELEECTLSDAKATVSANPATDTVRLAVRYDTYEPGRVTVHPRVRGGKGSFDFGRTTERFGRSGVYRETTHLNDAKMAKVLAGRQFTVQLRSAGDPSVCDGLFDQQLKRRGGPAPAWR